MAGVEKVKSQDPFTAPTKRSPRPRFHVKDPDERARLWEEFRQHLAQYREASEALRSGQFSLVPLCGNVAAASRFPEGCFPPALAFVGDRPPPVPPPPPTRRIMRSGKEVVYLGEIPVVEIPGRWWVDESVCEPRVRGQPS